MHRCEKEEFGFYDRSCPLYKCNSLKFVLITFRTIKRPKFLPQEYGRQVYQVTQQEKGFKKATEGQVTGF